MKRTKPSGRGRLRLALLAATAAAFLLVPAAQALAATGSVELAGTGEGWVSSAGGMELIGFPGAGEGEPATECSNIAGNVKEVCESTLRPGGFEDEPPGDEGFYAVHVVEAGPGSEFVGWTLVEGSDFLEEPCSVPAYGFCYINNFGASDSVIATFCPEGEPECASAPAEPFDVTAVKTGGGEGWVTSQDPGHALNCGLPCGERTASFEEPVVLHAYGRQFTGWSGCPEELSFRECEVSAEATVEAEFVSLKALTVKKLGGGEGWVTSLDAEHTLNCGLGCPEERTAYFESGPVELRAYGSQFQGWTNCAGGVSGYQNRVCTMELNADETAEVEFE